MKTVSKTQTQTQAVTVADNYCFAQAVKDFRLLDQAEKGRDYIVTLIETDLAEFVASANDLLIVDADSGKWLLNWVTNHVIRREGKYNRLLPVNMTVSTSKGQLSLKEKSDKAVKKDAILEKIAATLSQVTAEATKKTLSSLPTTGLTDCEAKLNAIETAVIEEKKAEHEARLMGKGLPLLIADQNKLPEGSELKLLKPNNLAELGEMQKTVREALAVIADEAKASLDSQPGNGELTLPRDKPQGVAKISTAATVSKDTVKKIQVIAKRIEGELTAIEIRELINQLAEFIADEFESDGTNG